MSGIGNVMYGECLVPECKDCPSWVNTKHAIGCGSHQPIDQCPAFKRAYQEMLKGQEAPGL